MHALTHARTHARAHAPHQLPQAAPIGAGLKPREAALFSHASPRLLAAVARVLAKLEAPPAPPADPLPRSVSLSRPLPYPGKSALLAVGVKAAPGYRLRRSEAKAAGGRWVGGRSAAAFISRDELRFYGVD
jgi:hypothetical protein